MEGDTYLSTLPTLGFVEGDLKCDDYFFDNPKSHLKYVEVSFGKYIQSVLFQNEEG